MLTQKITIEQVLERLRAVRKTARGWSARCPAHDDRSPSLSVAVGDDGRVLLYCWSGCTYREIVAALGFQPGDLMPGRTRPQTPAERQAAAEQARERELDRALEAWAAQAYIKLCVPRRACFLVLDEPDAYCCDLMLYCDHILDELQYGGRDEKGRDARQAALLAAMRMARDGQLGLPGAVLMA
jgi:hypothetical protein